jgi:HD-GYP domain-containing protein (c-di-GMP phosphodiesterase class II)
MKSSLLAMEIGAKRRVVGGRKMELPGTSRQLRWLLARRLGATALAVGAVAGALSYMLAIRGAEQDVLARTADSAKHFVSPAMQMAIDASAPKEHVALNRLLDRKHLVGIRVFNSAKTMIFETWGDIPAALIDVARSEVPDWQSSGKGHQKWIDVADERLILVVLPLMGEGGSPVGFLEGISRLDGPALRAQREQVRSGALTAVMSVLVTAAILYPLLLAMLRRSAALSHRLLESNLSLMRSLGNAVAKRDSDTDAHNYRVTLYAVAVAEAVGLSKPEISDLVAGAFLHDVGKIGIPDHILLKPGKLTTAEFEIMKTHVLLGLEIVADNPWLEGAAQTIRHHHERFDGGGYPDGLRGDAIPRVARIFSVVDVFDALTSVRPYKAAKTFAEAMSFIESGSGMQFDSSVVAVFARVIPGAYEKFGQAIEADLRKELRNVLLRYFKAEISSSERAETCAA